MLTSSETAEAVVLYGGCPYTSLREMLMRRGRYLATLNAYWTFLSAVQARKAVERPVRRLPLPGFEDPPEEDRLNNQPQ